MCDDACWEIAVEQARVLVTGVARLRRLSPPQIVEVLERMRPFHLDHRDPEGFENLCGELAWLLYPDVVDPGRPAEG